MSLQRAAFALSLVLGLTLPPLPSHAFDGAHLDRAPQDRQLSQADIERYQEIFAVQVDGAWTEADELIAQLENEILLGHVLVQRYLHPTHYRSKYKELAKWLDRYADHPDARRIYRLALKRKPSSAASPRRPVSVKSSLGAETPLDAVYLYRPRRS